MTKGNKIPVIGTSATHSKLSNSTRFPYYTRTTPSDSYLAVT